MTGIKILIAAFLCLYIGAACDELGDAMDIENFPPTADIESRPGEESAEARFDAGMGYCVDRGTFLGRTTAV